MKEMLDWLNSSAQAWNSFVQQPAAVLEQFNVNLPEQERAALIDDIHNLFKPVEYIPGWPISRLPKDVMQNTYEILMNQQWVFEAGIKSREEQQAQSL